MTDLPADPIGAAKEMPVLQQVGVWVTGVVHLITGLQG